MDFPAEKVIQIFRLLEESGVPVWLDGGWGIDALLNRVTREHLDLDLIVPIERLDAAESVLVEAEFFKDQGQTVMPVRVVWRNPEGLQIDIHPVTFRQDGSAEHVYFDEDTRDLIPFVHSASGLSGVGTISGRVVRCTTAAEQIRQRTERRYSPWKEGRARPSGISADLEDIISLQGAAAGGDKLAHSIIAGDGDTVVNRTKQFCLQRVAQLNAEHSELLEEHGRLSERQVQLKEQHEQLKEQHEQFKEQHEQFKEQHEQLKEQHEQFKEQHEQFKEQHEQLKEQYATCLAQLESMRASTSWRLTAPMRWAAIRLRRVAKVRSHS